MSANKNIVSYQFREDRAVEFEIMSLQDLFHRSRRMLIRPHRAGFYMIVWFRKGGFTHTVDFHHVDIGDNTVLFLKSDTVQVFADIDEVQGEVVLFTGAFFSKTKDDVQFLRDSVLFNDLFSISALHLPACNTIFSVLVDLMQKEAAGISDVYQESLLRYYLQGFLLCAERERRNQGGIEINRGPDMDYVMLFRDLLEEHFRESKQVGDYTSQLNITEKRLNLAINKVLGKTAKQLIDDRVILEAKRLLAHSREPIKVIAYALGFEEATNFIKYFRKHCGVTPAGFRERMPG